MEERQRQLHETGAPGVIGVSHAVVGLHRVGAAIESRGKSRKEVFRDRRVGIDDHNRLCVSRKNVLERVSEGVSFAALDRVVPLEHGGRSLSRALRGRVGAVVGDDHHAELVFGIVHRREALDRFGDPDLLVMGRDHHVEAVGPRRCRRRRRSRCAREDREREQVSGAGENRQTQDIASATPTSHMEPPTSPARSC